MTNEENAYIIVLTVHSSATGRKSACLHAAFPAWADEGSAGLWAKVAAKRRKAPQARLCEWRGVNCNLFYNPTSFDKIFHFKQIVFRHIRQYRKTWRQFYLSYRISIFKSIKILIIIQRCIAFVNWQFPLLFDALNKKLNSTSCRNLVFHKIPFCFIMIFVLSFAVERGYYVKIYTR